jgi:hypothetical protein
LDAENLHSGFDKIRRSNCTIYINRAFRSDSLEQALPWGEKELQRQFQLTRLGSSKFVRLYKFTLRFDGADRLIYFKQYLNRSAWDFIKHIFRASRARRAFEAALVLAERGFQTPIIIATGEFRYAFIGAENFLVTLGIEHAKPIYQFIASKQAELTKEQLRRERDLIRTFGRTVGKMHAAGIFHGDLRLGNVLAKQDNNGWRFFFLDNERTREFRRLPARLRLKNLVQVNMFCSNAITKIDRMRFFKSYLKENPDIRNNYKNLAKKVTAKTTDRLKTKLLTNQL